jgi:hypothetical protein
MATKALPSCAEDIMPPSKRKRARPILVCDASPMLIPESLQTPLYPFIFVVALYLACAYGVQSFYKLSFLSSAIE